MRSDDISADIIGTPPSGDRDLGMRVGVVLLWDESTNENVINIEGTLFEDLNIVQGGIGIQYQTGDVVVVVRSKTTYFILGKVAAPGGNAASQVKYAEVSGLAQATSTSYSDLATYGPELSINIGSSKRCLLMVGATIQCWGTASNTLMGGDATVNVSGASAISTVGTVHAGWMGQASPIMGGFQSVVRNFVLTAGNGLNQGVNTFTMKYRTTLASPTAYFSERNITVIPF